MTVQWGSTHYLPNLLAILSSYLLPTITIPIKRTHLLSLVAIIFGLLDHENEGTKVLQNTENNSPNDKASHPRKLEVSTTLPWEPQIWQAVTGFICSDFLISPSSKRLFQLMCLSDLCSSDMWCMNMKPALPLFCCTNKKYRKTTTSQSSSSLHETVKKRAPGYSMQRGGPVPDHLTLSGFTFHLISKQICKGEISKLPSLKTNHCSCLHSNSRDTDMCRQ